MSEHQYVAFRAVDAPVSKENLEYMRKQSSRARITPRSFENEYHYGDFRGNALEMLRRGYDVHLHYANFGTRTIMIRLPAGLPDPKAAEPYFVKDGMVFKKDKGSLAGTLCIEPCFESGQLPEVWDFRGLMKSLAELREEIIAGDPRPLYLAQLAVLNDLNHDPEEIAEVPVPAGLKRLTSAQQKIAAFLGLNKKMVNAATEGLPGMDAPVERAVDYKKWIERQPEATKNKWLAKLLADPQSGVLREIQSQLKKSGAVTAWPTFVRNKKSSKTNR